MIGIVVRRFRGEIGKTLGGGINSRYAIKAHAGIDVFGGEGRVGAVSIGIELDENVIPDFDAARA